ncbi:hypothetical protein [Caulobacter sp. UC70_42]|uniref:hypothetical protein n=1 Tax=Caulobacter sp. UC70_42 TaxID=3374551 RepID=UPI0037571703
MSLTASAIRLLAAKGLSAEEIADVAEANASEGQAKRSKAAERTARWRDRKNAETVTVTSQNVTDNETENRHRDVTERHTVTPLARVRDNITNSVDRPNLTTLHNADVRPVSGDDVEWPPVSPPERRYLDRLEGLLRHVGGNALNQTAPNLMVLAPILALGSAGSGPICDLYADIIPTIAARCAKARPNSITQWGYFTEAIREARDRRLAGAPATQEIRHERPNAQSAKFERRQAAHADDFAGSELAVDLRAERRARYL